MSIIASTTHAGYPTWVRRRLSAALVAAGIAAGALLHPAIADAGPSPVTPTPHPVAPGAPLTPNLPPGPGPGESGGWDIEAYDACIKKYGNDWISDHDCCVASGGYWHNMQCQAPAGNNAQ